MISSFADAHGEATTAEATGIGSDCARYEADHATFTTPSFRLKFHNDGSRAWDEIRQKPPLNLPRAQKYMIHCRPRANRGQRGDRRHRLPDDAVSDHAGAHQDVGQRNRRKTEAHRTQLLPARPSAE